MSTEALAWRARRPRRRRATIAPGRWASRPASRPRTGKRGRRALPPEWQRQTLAGPIGLGPHNACKRGQFPSLRPSIALRARFGKNNTYTYHLACSLVRLCGETHMSIGRLLRFWRLTTCSNAGAMADTASFASDGYKDLLLRQNSMKTVSALASALTACCCLISQALFADVTVTIQPATNYFVPGGSATFNAQVTATGGETVRSYAWLLATNLNPPTIVIAGAN